MDMPATTRRQFLATMTLGSVAASAVVARGQTASVGLSQLRKAGVIKIGIANQPPYSGLNPDGTITGLAPTVVQVIMGRLSVPKVEGIVAPYGQLIPGLQAGRWAMFGAVLTITKERCQQVVYADPVNDDGGAFGFIPTVVTEGPKSLAEAKQRQLKIGILTGSYLAQKLQGAGVP